MSASDFAIYLPASAERPVWDAVVTSVGHAVSPPGATYPSSAAGHPADHFFSWERGRILDAWQIVVIHQGSGCFESGPSGKLRLSAGSTFLVFPGVWHRYAPDNESGWTETWVELEGGIPDELWKKKQVDPAFPAHLEGSDPDFLDALERCLALASSDSIRSTAVLSAVALELFARWIANRRGPAQVPKRMDSVVLRARSLLAADRGFELSIDKLARSLSVAPSHLRRIFKSQTGLSPKQYQRQIRLRRASLLLRNSGLSIAEIGNQLGYASAFHLSADFKKTFGKAPSLWRHGIPTRALE